MEPQARGLRHRRADQARCSNSRARSDATVAGRDHRFLRRHQHARHLPPRARAPDRDGRTVRSSSPRRWNSTSRNTASNRGFEGEWPKGYEDDSQPFTPAWQERFTGVAGSVAVNFAREWARTAEHTGGKCSVIIGAGVNHWYHNNLIYRAVINSLIFCGCIGKSGGGLNHYVGQEKLVPQTSWAPIAFGGDWAGPPRQQNAPSFHYMHSDQWRYDKAFSEMCPVSDAKHPMAHGHTADKQALAVRLGWLPCYPQFTKSNFEVIKEAQAAGAKTDEEIVATRSSELK